MKRAELMEPFYWPIVSNRWTIHIGSIRYWNGPRMRVWLPDSWPQHEWCMQRRPLCSRTRPTDDGNAKQRWNRLRRSAAARTSLGSWSKMNPDEISMWSWAVGASVWCRMWLAVRLIRSTHGRVTRPMAATCCAIGMSTSSNAICGMRSCRITAI